MCNVWQIINRLFLANHDWLGWLCWDLSFSLGLSIWMVLVSQGIFSSCEKGSGEKISCFLWEEYFSDSTSMYACMIIRAKNNRVHYFGERIWGQISKVGWFFRKISEGRRKPFVSLPNQKKKRYFAFCRLTVHAVVLRMGEDDYDENRGDEVRGRKKERERRYYIYIYKIFRGLRLSL